MGACADVIVVDLKLVRQVNVGINVDHSRRCRYPIALEADM